MLLKDTTIEELEQAMRFHLNRAKEILTASCGISREDAEFCEGRIEVLEDLLGSYFEE